MLLIVSLLDYQTHTQKQKDCITNDSNKNNADDGYSDNNNISLILKNLEKTRT